MEDQDKTNEEAKPIESISEETELNDATEGAEGELSEEELVKTNIIGFIVAPAALVIAVVGIIWVFWYLTYNPYSPQDYVRLLDSENKSTRWQAALDMVETDRASEDLVPILLEMADATDEDQSVIDAVVFDMRDLLKTPEEKKVNLRWYSVAALGKVGGDEAFAKLTELLTDEDEGVRFYAVHGLGRIRSPESVDPLIERLKNDEDYGVQSAAAWALGELGDPKAAPALLEIYRNDDNLDVRWNTALSLARFGEEEVMPTLVEMTKADNAHTRDQGRRAMKLLEEQKAKK